MKKEDKPKDANGGGKKNEGALKKLKRIRKIVRVTKFLPIVAIFVIVIVIISACKEYLKLEAATRYGSNGNSASETSDSDEQSKYYPQAYYESLYITEDGTLMAGTSVQDMWDNEFKNQSTYVSNVDELAYWLNAQVVTQYPYIEGADEDALNGTIKFYRNNSEEAMKYVSENDLESYISSYNSGGNTEAREKALSSFHLNKDGTITVAYLTETTYTVTTDDAGAASIAAEKIGAKVNGNTVTRTESMLETTTIAYQSYVQPYTIPFQLLWSIACIGEDGNAGSVNANDFVHAMASMAYDSEIDLIIDDNNTVTTNTDTYTYDKQVTKSLLATCEGKSQQFNDISEVIAESGIITTFVEIDNVNSPGIKLKHIKSWCAKYDNDAKYTTTDSGTEAGNSADLDDEKDYSDVKKYKESTTISTCKYSSINRWIKEAGIKSTEMEGGTVNPGVETVDSSISINVEDKYKRVNIKEGTTTKVVSKGFSNGSVTSPEFNEEIVELFKSPIYKKVTQYISKDLYHDYFLKALEKNSDTANMVDLIKFIFNKVWKTDKYGKDLTFDSVWSQIYSSINNGMSTVGGLEFVREYINNFEGEKTSPSNPNEYIVYNGGDGVRTVGYGVTLENNPEKFKAHGIDISKSYSTISKEIVDAIELEIIQDKYNAIVKATPNLKEYQIYALISRSYNYNASGFTNHYNKYWNEERDDKYGQNIPEKPKEIHSSQARTAMEHYKGIINNDLFSNYMSTPITQNHGTEFLGGLAKRRYCEWLLFQYGYVYYNDTYYSETNNSSENISSNETVNKVISIAKSKEGCKYVWGADGPNEFDCSGLMEWCYKQVGITIPGYTAEYTNSKYNKYKVNLSDIQPGDVLWRHQGDHGHCGLYIGNDTFIHAPQTGDVVKESSVKAYGKFTCAYRFWENK